MSTTESISEYKEVVSSQVNAALQEGWEVHGSPTIDLVNGGVIQVVVKKTLNHFNITPNNNREIVAVEFFKSGDTSYTIAVDDILAFEVGSNADCSHTSIFPLIGATNDGERQDRAIWNRTTGEWSIYYREASGVGIVSLLGVFGTTVITDRDYLKLGITK